MFIRSASTGSRTALIQGTVAARVKLTENPLPCPNPQNDRNTSGKKNLYYRVRKQENRQHIRNIGFQKAKKQTASKLQRNQTGENVRRKREEETAGWGSTPETTDSQGQRRAQRRSLLLPACVQQLATVGLLQVLGYSAGQCSEWGDGKRGPPPGERLPAGHSSPSRPQEPATGAGAQSRHTGVPTYRDQLNIKSHERLKEKVKRRYRETLSQYTVQQDFL